MTEQAIAKLRLELHKKEMEVQNVVIDLKSKDAEIAILKSQAAVGRASVFLELFTSREKN